MAAQQEQGERDGSGGTRGHVTMVPAIEHLPGVNGVLISCLLEHSHHSHAMELPLWCLQQLLQLLTCQHILLHVLAAIGGGQAACGGQTVQGAAWQPAAEP